MTPLQRARSELKEVHDKFKARTARRGNHANHDNQRAAAKTASGVEQGNITIKEKLRRTFSPRSRGKLITMYFLYCLPPHCHGSSCHDPCLMTGQHAMVATLMHAMLLLQPAVVQLAAVTAFVAIPSVHVTHVHAAHSCAHTSDHRDSAWNLDHRFREKPISSKLFE